jgi:hypothetical protein
MIFHEQEFRVNEEYRKQLKILIENGFIEKYRDFISKMNFKS